VFGTDENVGSYAVQRGWALLGAQLEQDCGGTSWLCFPPCAKSYNLIWLRNWGAARSTP